MKRVKGYSVAKYFKGYGTSLSSKIKIYLFRWFRSQASLYLLNLLRHIWPHCASSPSLFCCTQDHSWVISQYTWQKQDAPSSDKVISQCILLIAWCKRWARNWDTSEQECSVRIVYVLQHYELKMNMLWIGLTGSWCKLHEAKYTTCVHN